MALGHISVAGCQVQLLAQLAFQFGQRVLAAPGGRKLDRQRHAIQRKADLRHGRGDVLAHHEVRAGGLRAVGEKLHGGGVVMVQRGVGGRFNRQRFER